MVLFAAGALAILELVMLVIGSCGLASHTSKKMSNDSAQFEVEAEKLQPVQFLMMRVSQMVDYLAQSKIKDSKDARLG